MKVTRILFASGAANLGGLQSSTHTRMLALRRIGVRTEKLFRKAGAGVATYSDVPTSITDDPRRVLGLLRSRNFDAVSMINRTDLLPLLRQVGFTGRVLFEVRGKAKHALTSIPKLRPDQIGGILVISQYVKELVAQKLGVKSIPIHVVYNAIDTDLFRPLLTINTHGIPFGADANSRPIVLWVGRLSENKNYVEMLEVAKLLVNEPPHPIFWVVSDTYAKRKAPEFQAAVQTLGLEDDVRLLQCIPHRRMVDIYNLVSKSGGCVLSTSKSEGFQNSLLEGMACGVPVVASAVGGNVELVADGVNGLLYPIGHPKTAAEAITQLLTDAKHRQAYIDAAFDRLHRHHSPQAHAEQFMSVLMSTPVLTFQPKPRRVRPRPQVARPVRRPSEERRPRPKPKTTRPTSRRLKPARPRFDAKITQTRRPSGTTQAKSMGTKRRNLKRPAPTRSQSSPRARRRRISTQR